MKKLKSGSNQRKLINILQCRGEKPFLGRLLLASFLCILVKASCAALKRYFLLLGEDKLEHGHGVFFQPLDKQL